MNNSNGIMYLDHLTAIEEFIEKVSNIRVYAIIAISCSNELIEMIEKYNPENVGILEEQNTEKLFRHFPQLNIYVGEQGVNTIFDSAGFSREGATVSHNLKYNVIFESCRPAS